MCLFKDPFRSPFSPDPVPVIAYVVDWAVFLTHRIVPVANRPGTKFAEVEPSSMAMARTG
jgi:hypothetical protein